MSSANYAVTRLTGSVTNTGVSEGEKQVHCLNSTIYDSLSSIFQNYFEYQRKLIHDVKLVNKIFIHGAKCRLISDLCSKMVLG